jgi:hypothetical protein
VPRKDGVVTTDAQHPVRVVQLGGLMPFVREWLAERYAAPVLADLDDPAGVEVAVVGGGAPAGATSPRLAVAASSSPTPPTC